MRMKDFINDTIALEGYMSSLYTDICNFNDEMNTYKYGLSIDGTIDKKRDTTAADYDVYYRLASPDQFIKQHGGICWDFTTYEANWFKTNHPELKFETYYIGLNLPPDYPTHTFLVIQMDNQYIYFESSFKKIQGVYIFKSESDVINFVMYNMDKYRPKFHKKSLFKLSDGYIVTKYNALDKKLYDSTCAEFMEYCEAGKNMHFTYNSKFNQPEKIN